jgi:hypothetical protein
MTDLEHVRALTTGGTSGLRRAMGRARERGVCRCDTPAHACIREAEAAEATQAPASRGANSSSGPSAITAGRSAP